MIALAADENFNNRILRGLVRRNKLLDILRIQDVGLSGASDPEVLTWAADAGRVLITHDVATMVQHARRRIETGQVMSGLIACRRNLPIRTAIEDLLLIAECSLEHEWDNTLLFLPL